MTDVIETGQKAPPKMLIADDDPAIVRLLADRCMKMGFKVETAANGMQLLIKARRSQPDIMIVDVNMPEMDGLSVCSRLLDPGSKRVEVVVVTGNSDPETAERCESLGLFYGRKGPDFWKSIETALTEIYPDMAGRIEEQEMQSTGAEIHQRPRVLVIDDDPAIQEFLSSRLAKHGIDTLYATDAVHGFRMACKEHPSVIITDNFMPDGDAQYLLHRLRSAPATESIPVFIISGRDIDEVTQQTLRREIGGHPGAARIFKKSFDTEELFGALKKFCAFGIGQLAN
ncbi:MAG: response regulator [Pseudolabrys sp.]